MERSVPQKLNVVLATRLADAGEYLARVRAIAPDRINVRHIWDDFMGEMAEEWPPRMMSRNGSEVTTDIMSRPELDAVLADTHVMLLGVPFPKRVASRAPNLLWAHFTFAGITNLAGSQWWEPHCAITSSRGVTNALPIAESVIAATMMFARRLDLAALNTNPNFDAGLVPPMISVAGKTMGIVGLGGIGRDIARLSHGLGMRVVATRRSAERTQEDAEGVDVLYPVSETLTMLAESDFVAVCAMWTAETEGMFDRTAFAAMKPGSFFMNVARGELVQEPALIEALASGHVAAAYLDVWPDDFATPPNPELLKLPNVVITPHISNRADTSFSFGNELFLDNLKRLIDGETLVNEVDWERSY